MTFAAFARQVTWGGKSVGIMAVLVTAIHAFLI